MSDDDFMFSGLRTPPTAFVRQLRARLEAADLEWGSAPRIPRLRWAAAIAGVLILGAALTQPSVRAAAMTFLDFFRVVNFAPVSVQADRLSQLGEQGIDLPRILGQQTQRLQPPPAPRVVATAEAAGAAAGIALALPAWRPVGLDLQRIEVKGSQAWRFTASTRKLEQVLTSLGIDDLSVPASIDGQAVTMSVPPVVRIVYGDQTRSAVLMESRQPQVSLPAGTDVAQLAEIALRVLGVDREEAYRMAQSIDWRTTLLVPIPADVSNFRQVDIEGHAGLLMTMARRTARGRLPVESRILWSTGDRVFALIGNVPPNDLFDMAQSMQ